MMKCWQHPGKHGIQMMHLQRVCIKDQDTGYFLLIGIMFHVWGCTVSTWTTGDKSSMFWSWLLYDFAFTITGFGYVPWYVGHSGEPASFLRVCWFGGWWCHVKIMLLLPDGREFSSHFLLQHVWYCMKVRDTRMIVFLDVRVSQMWSLHLCINARMINQYSHESIYLRYIPEKSFHAYFSITLTRFCIWWQVLSGRCHNKWKHGHECH